MKLLLAFPNESIIDFLYFALKNENHEVVGINKEQEIINYLENDTADILVFDYDEFKKDKDVIRKNRNNYNNTIIKLQDNEDHKRK